MLRGWLGLGVLGLTLGLIGCGDDEGGTVVDAAGVVVDAAASRDGGGGAGDGAAGGDGALVACGCAAFLAPTSVGNVIGAGKELSGIAASRRHRGILYVHNDDAIAGDLTVYAIDERAAVVATFRLPGAETKNLEDIAVGPCGGVGAAGSCVFVGNIGDNAGTAVERQIHRFPEPDALASGIITPTTLRYDYRVSNHRDRAVDVVVLDHLPVSRSQGLSVQTTAATRAFSPRRDGDAPGVVRWNHRLAPAESERWSLGVVVRSPPRRTVNGEID